MGTAERIERERQEKRARILDAARELFVEKGVEAVTLREIAQRIEYSTTAIYVQFKDKAALVDAMVAEDFAQFAASLATAAGVVDPVERIGVLQDAYVEFALRMPRHYQLLFLTPPVHTTKAPPPTDATPAGMESYNLLLDTVRECIATQRFREELTDVDAVAQTVWASVHGMVSLQIVLGHYPEFHWAPRKKLERTSYDMLLHGLLREPREPRESREPRKKSR